MEEYSFTVNQDLANQRLDKCINLYDDKFSRNYVQKLIAEQKVLVNNTCMKPNYSVKEGDEISFSIPDVIEMSNLKKIDIPLDILYEDDDVIVVNKPKGMVVHPAPGHDEDTLVNAILYHCNGNLSGINGVLRPGIVHRIDMNTTGSLIICKNDFAHNSIALQLKEHSIVRKYEGIVYGRLKEENGTIRTTIGRNPKDRKKMATNVTNGKEAITHYRCLEYFDNYTYVEFQLETGRTHQIRVHMAHIGHPLVGDMIYGPDKDPFHTQGQVLHAKILGFMHPRTNEYIETEAPLPEYFVTLLQKLRNSSK